MAKMLNLFLDFTRVFRVESCKFGRLIISMSGGYMCFLISKKSNPTKMLDFE